MLKLSIVIPSFAQGEFIDQTILSILQQKYPSLEVIIFDGGSTDSTISVIKKHEEHIHYWVSESDRGQSHAINKGFEKISGDIVAWINSDDKYLPWAFDKIMNAFEDPSVMWVTGDCEVIDENDNVINYYKTELPRNYFHWLSLLVLGYSTTLIQPSTFWRREVLQKAGNLRENFHYSFDHEFFYRIFKEYGPPKFIDSPLSQFRLHSRSKTVSQDHRFRKENQRIGLMHAKVESFKRRFYLYAIYLRQLFKNV